LAVSQESERSSKFSLPAMMAYLSHIFTSLNDLNMSIKGTSVTILEVEVEAMILKLGLRLQRVCLNHFQQSVIYLIFGPTGDEVKGKWKKLQIRSFIICTHPQISLGRPNRGE
jgi:hypothetical protein